MKVTKRLIRRDVLRSKIPLSDSQIYALEKEEKFPARIQLTPRCVAWDEAEVDAWIEARKADPAPLKAAPPDVRLRKTRPVRHGASAQAEVDAWIEARKADSEPLKAAPPDVRLRKTRPVRHGASAQYGDKGKA